MKLHFELTKPNRFFKQFSSVSISDYWYNEDTGEWGKSIEELGEGFISPYKKCNSVKAFKREIKKMVNKVPVGTMFHLHSKYMGADVYFHKK